MVFQTAPKPRSLLGWHRILSPTASVKVSPICLGGISIGNAWKFYTGKNEDPFKLLDAFYELGDARQHGLTPFSVYQGNWNAAMRDMEGEAIHMCEDQGMAVIPWGALGSGSLLTAEQRKERENDPDAPDIKPSETALKTSEALEKIATRKGTTLQAIALAYLFHQTTYVFPIVGVNTVEHIKAMPEALRIKLSKEEIDEIHDASPYNPGFPMNFTQYIQPVKYDLSWTPADHQQYQMAAWIDAPPKSLPYQPRTE
ncbi:hypothetical protein NW752_009087 [Fusarium irregulare]|uniref:NADP-dependent oxidoreductase domain-containing protein n=1 Tax=Fusarium irregulare TaxID=2494466 RepID=A0A9W8U7Z8_9HYPO|nr:hypothetical protein NW766_008614 [Fusarium irregulare]KAJ4009913.1 hypothetical protein NW752_009087 [Fusarium irregulare]